MRNRRSRLILVLATFVLFAALAVGTAAPDLALQMAGSQPDTSAMWVGLEDCLLGPSGPSGSNGG